MEDISLHILDIAENSLRADAAKIEITLSRDRQHDLLRIEVNDNGRGMDAETLAKIRDPFFSTKQKKTGLGIPLLSQAAEQTGGRVTIDSSPGKGTRLTATFQWSHLDRPPVGDLAATLLTLIAGHPDRDYIYQEQENGNFFRFDTREVKADIDPVPITEPQVLKAIGAMLKENLKIRE